MRLSQPLSYPKPPQDFYTEQMRKLSRDTSTMMLHMLDMIPETKSDMYVELNSMLTADWDDSTHTMSVHIAPFEKTRIRQTITVVDNQRMLTVTALFTPRWVPDGAPRVFTPAAWTINMFDGSDASEINELHVPQGLFLAIMRSLTIQRGIPLAIEQGYIGQSFIREAENGGVPESVEPLFIRFGGEYFHNLLENTWDQYVNTLTKD